MQQTISTQNNTQKKAPSSFTESAAKQEFKKNYLGFSGFNDPYYIENKDPNRSYKHISWEDFQKNGYRDIRGWIPLVKQNLTTEIIPQSEDFGIKTDGFWHVGDTIVAWMPKERFNQMRQMVLEKTKLKTQHVTEKREAKGIANSAPVPITLTDE